MSNQHTGGKWTCYDNEIKRILEENDGIEPIDVVKKINLGLDGLERQAFSKYIRRNKTRLLDRNEGIYEACEEIKVDFTSAKNLWIKTKNKDGSGVSGFIVNPEYQPTEVALMSTLQDDLIKSLQDYIPKFAKLERIVNSDSYLLVIDPADIHIGKLCSSCQC